MPSRRSAHTADSPDSLKRQRAGTYATEDGRFTVETSSSGWLLFDADQIDDLGLPLTRGAFPTLDGARAAIGPARSAPPASSLAHRTPGSAAKHRKAARAQPKAPERLATADNAREPDAAAAFGYQVTGPIGESITRRTSPKPARLRRPAVVVRAIRTVDGDALRALWADCGFNSLGDDDRSLARLARRNPGLVLVAAEGTRVIGSALGAWDGRRGWIYHVATARTHRRQGIAKRLIAEVETGLRALGCPKVNVLVRHENDDGAAFWRTLGYGPGTARQLAKELDAS